MKVDLFSGKSDKSTSYYFKKFIVASKPTHYNWRRLWEVLSKIKKILEKMNSRIEKVTVYLGRGKDPMMNPEGENPLLETDLSSNNDKRWPKGTPSEKALRRVIVRSKIRKERKPELSHRYRRRSKTDRRTRVVEPRSSNSTSDRTWDTMEALKQQVLELKKELKKNKNPRRSEHFSRPKTRSRPKRHLSSYSSSMSVGETDEEESSDGRNKG
jgi:hypothetical protein